MNYLDSEEYEFSDEDYNERYGRYGNLLEMSDLQLRDEALKCRNTCNCLYDELANVSDQLTVKISDYEQLEQELQRAYEENQELQYQQWLYERYFKWFFWTWLITASVILFTPDVVNLVNSYTAK